MVFLPFLYISGRRKNTILKRLGITSFNKDKNIRPIWIHALSVGELGAVIPLIDRLKKFYRKDQIVLSVTTKAGFELANDMMKNEVGDIFFFPFDLIFSVKHVLKKIDPSLIVINETDIWPNFLRIAKKKNIPAVLINARLSDCSIKFKRIFGKIFLNFDTICVRTKKDKKSFQLLGYPTEKLIVAGNTKFDIDTDGFDSRRAKDLKKDLGIDMDRKIIVAGSTHKGEEIIIKGAFLKLKNEFTDLLLIVAPRNHLRGYEVAKLFRNFKTGLLSRMEKGKIGENDVFIIDCIGILKQFYEISDLAFVGGSLTNNGGHNPLEPASYSKPVLTGGFTEDFKEMYETLLQSKGVVIVSNAEDFYKEAASILKDAKKAEIMGKANLDVLNSNKGAVSNISRIIIEGY